MRNTKIQKSNKLNRQITKEEKKVDIKSTKQSNIKISKTYKDETISSNIETKGSINSLSKCLLSSSKEKLNPKKFDNTKTKILRKTNLNFSNNNNNENNLSNSNTKKTIFTKLTEQMFDNLLKNNGSNIYDYESFTNESLLQKFSKVEKEEKNKKLIKDFIERNEKQKEKKKTNKDKVSSPNQKTNEKNKKKVNLKEFFSNQNKFTEKKKENIEIISKKLESEEIKKFRDKPLINSKSNKIIYSKKSNEIKKDIHIKLYEDFTERKKNKTIQSEENHSKSKEKIFPKNLSTIYNKLYEDSKERSKSQRENEKKNLNQISKSFIVNYNSNEILAQKFLKKYETEITILFNKKAEDDFNINFSEFLLLLNKIGFTIKNYSNTENNENNLEKEFQLSKEAWIIITEKNIFDENEIISSHKFIIFFLYVLNLYDINILKKNFSFINNNNKNFIEEKKLKKELPNKFRLFVNNELNIFLKKEKLNRTSLSFIEDLENTYTFKPKINDSFQSKSFISNLNESHISVVKGYNEYRIEREKSLEIKKKTLLDKELKECSFFPNNKILQRSKSLSNSVSQRLYSRKKKDKIKEKELNDNNIINNFTPIKNNFSYKIFKNDLIQTDDDVIRRCEQLQKIRNEKKITQYLLSKGYSCNNTENLNNKNILKKANQSFKNFVFDNEINNNFKNTFNKFSDSKKKRKNIKYVFEVNVDNKKKKIIINKGDDLDKKVEKFCLDNDLDIHSKPKIIYAIKERFHL